MGGKLQLSEGLRNAKGGSVLPFSGAKKLLGLRESYGKIFPQMERSLLLLSVLGGIEKYFLCWGVQRFALHWSESQDKYWQRGNEKLETASFKLSPEGTVIAAHCEHQGHCHQQLWQEWPWSGEPCWQTMHHFSESANAADEMRGSHFPLLLRQKHHKLPRNTNHSL